MKIKQKDAVYNAIENLFSQSGKSIEGQVALTKEERAEVVEMITVGIHEGEVEFSDEAKTKYPDFKSIKSYVPGLVNNWLRKDTRLNGNTKYEAKNPGSRSGQGDDVLKNLKALRTQLVTLGDTEGLTAVDQEITNRKSELTKSKAKKVEINVDLIPESLRHLIQE
jgi:hypothetical protein